MPSNFPGALDTSVNLPNPVPGDSTLLDNANPLLVHSYQHETENDAIIAIEAKLGIDGSMNTSTIDWNLYNTSSLDPGHQHSFDSLSDFSVGTPVANQVLRYDGSHFVNTTMSGLAIGETILNNPHIGGILYANGSQQLATTSNLTLSPTLSQIALGLPISDALAKFHVKSADATNAARFEGLGDNTLYQALTLLNNDLPLSGEISQAVIFDLLLMRSIGGVPSPGVGGRFIVGKEAGADWVGVDLAAAQANRSAYFAISTVSAGNTTEKMRVTSGGILLVGLTTVTGSSKFQTNGGIRIGANTDAASVAGGGALRYNTSVIEFSNGTSWAALGSGGGGGSLSIGSAVGGGINNSLLYVDGSGLLGNSSLLFFSSDTVTMRRPAISTSQTTIAIEVENTTNAAAGAQQFSPGISWEAQGWKTNATAGSQPVRFRMFVAPIQGAAAPTGELVIMSSVNGVDAVNFPRFSTAGVLGWGQGLNNDRGSVGMNSNGLDMEVRGATQNLDLLSNSSFGIRFGTSTGSVGSRYQPSSDRFYLGNSTGTANGRLSMPMNTLGSPGEAWGITWQDINASHATRISIFPAFSGDHRTITPQSAEIRTNLWIGDSATLGAFSAPGGLAAGLVIASSTAPSSDPTQTNSVALFSTATGLGYRGSVSNEGSGRVHLVHNRSNVQLGAGTDYSLTTSLAAIDFGTDDPSISLPTAGTYLVFGSVGLVSGATPSESYEAQLYNTTDAAAIGQTNVVMNGVASQELVIPLYYLVTITASKTVTIRARNADSAAGSVVSTLTHISYVRLA